MSQPLTRDPLFYRRWVLANGWAEAVGLGTTFVLGRELAPWLDDARGALVVVASAMGAVLLGTLLEGVIVGVAQEAVLRRRLPLLRTGSWVVATAVGAGIAWLLGMVPSTVMALTPQTSGGPPPSEPPALVQHALGGVLGLVVGPVLGIAQWVVLRRHVARSTLWLGANAVAWAIGMPLIFLGMDHVPWEGSRWSVLAAIYAVCGAAGLVVGAVHGRFLVHLLRPEHRR